MSNKGSVTSQDEAESLVAVQGGVTHHLAEINDVAGTTEVLGKGRKLTAVIDGGVSPNPGHGVAGVVYFTDTGQKAVTRYLGNAVGSNEAEFHALLLALHNIPDGYRRNCRLEIKTDSKLLMGFLTGSEDMRKTRFASLAKEAMQEVKSFGDRLSIQWVRRDEVSLADAAVSKALRVYIPITRALTADRRVQNAFVEFISEKYGAGHIRVVGNTASIRGVAFRFLGYYTLDRPSVSERVWGRWHDDSDILVWCPYGSNAMPKTAKGEGAELLVAAFTELKLGTKTDRRGYDGGAVYTIEGNFVPAHLMNWNEPEGVIQCIHQAKSLQTQ